jgi:hypothetical protein
MKIVILLLFVAALSDFTFARRVPKCEVMKALYRAGVPKGDLPDWNCLIQGESSYLTNQVSPTQDYGIFQINGNPAKGNWCRNGSVGGQCNINCQSEFHSILFCRFLIKPFFIYFFS